MASTGTYAFSPAASNLTMVAFGRIGLRRTELLAQHWSDADVEANLVQTKISNLQPNLWKSELYEQELTAGTATYTLPARMIAIQAAYISTETDDQDPIDRIIWPYSVFEWSAIPDKEQQGVVTAYWYDRQITPQINLWPVPDDADDTTYTLKLRIIAQPQDVSQASGYTLDLPYRWLDVYVAELAYRLSRIYAPDKEQMRKQDAKDAWDNAAFEDQERVPIYITPSLGSYWGV